MMKYIRNFCIIAHIDHGKSTLSDRLIEACTSTKVNKILDSMELEKERGITIKASCINLEYKYVNRLYKLNLIDTPGHVDFYYEVCRAIFACEGAILLIDLTKGVQAQTLAKYRLALANNLYIIPVFNKIDISDINRSRVIEETKKILFFYKRDLICSAKTGEGIPMLLEEIIQSIPPPKGDLLSPLQAIIIDSWFDDYLGVICLIRIKNGCIKKLDKIQLMTSKAVYVVAKLGSFIPDRIELQELKCGEIGWVIISGVKNLKQIPVGDTITLKEKPATNILPSFKKMKPQIYATLYPINQNDYDNLKKALFKLSFNDAALQYETESSSLGLGFKCGFLGRLHLEVIQERLKREYKLEIIITAPSVNYKILMKNKQIIEISSPSQLPNHLSLIKEISEPIAICDILIPKIYLRKIIQLCIGKRGIQKRISYADNKVYLTYELPLSEIITDLYQKLQILSKGYASLDYTFVKYKKSPIMIFQLLINKNRIDEFQLFIHLEQAKNYANYLVSKMKDYIPRQQFEIIIQASINNKIIVSGIIKPIKKDVIHKCSGGDVTRKQKLLMKQKIGKDKMKQIGRINIPQKAFLAVFKYFTN